MPSAWCIATPGRRHIAVLSMKRFRLPRNAVSKRRGLKNLGVAAESKDKCLEFAAGPHTHANDRAAVRGVGDLLRGVPEMGIGVNAPTGVETKYHVLHGILSSHEDAERVAKHLLRVIYGTRRVLECLRQNTQVSDARQAVRARGRCLALCQNVQLMVIDRDRPR